ncbi:mRNA-processing endoribonuclease [Spizellomyces punctatus DAOM BR117]|uniref:PIN domain-containing protein n=1 Tax=Spizellomyces punctatus (strain DAOM BR117) TaxID=645134 RepID=A0A0L0HMW0_SPIPD|nr:mRNA-processing endoribonuclease [Spizellomyces punctatus DAOM BR117]KND02260.1 hypothetical protein SPPG_02739 [Spizellomyces punctatus DAOM BR117]|eukprot:XP_016610299.1 hypothetical protein SPPG_02739 [Spizellomyces punctatus DAOM BR117]
MLGQHWNHPTPHIPSNIWPPPALLSNMALLSPVDNDDVLPMDIDDEELQQAFTEEIASFRRATVPPSYDVQLIGGTGSLTAGPGPCQVDRLLDPMELDKTGTPYSAVFVIDTCFLISHLRFVKQVLDILPAPDMIMLLPYVVLKELDSLKDSHKGSVRKQAAAVKDRVVRPDNIVADDSVSNGKAVVDSPSEISLAHCARQAIDLLYQTLLKGAPALKGQRITDHLPGMDLTQMNNDDRILECCRFAQVRYTPRVVLMSNDKNLCVKALIHSIYTVSNWKKSPAEFISEARRGLELSPAVSNTTRTAAAKPKPNNGNKKSVLKLEKTADPPRDSDKAVIDGMVQDQVDLMDIDELVSADANASSALIFPERASTNREGQADPVDIIIKQLSDTLVGSMSAAFPVLFQRQFGKEWRTKVAHKPPWSVSDLFEVINNHWLLFRDILPSGFGNDLSWLRQISRDLRRGYVTAGELRRILGKVQHLHKVCEKAGFYKDAERMRKIMNEFNDMLNKK